MALLLSGITDFVKQNAVTGNQLLDTIILANVLPILIAYTTSMFELIKNSLTALILYCWEFCVDKVKTSVNGKILCTTFIRPNSPVFLELKSMIADEKKYPCQCTIGIQRKLLEALENNSFKYTTVDDIYVMNVTKDENTAKFQLSQGYHKKDTKSKVFMYNDLYFTFTHYNSKIDDQKTVVEDYIKLCVVTYSKKKYEANEISDIFNSFVVNELNLNNGIIYINVVSINKPALRTIVDSLFDKTSGSGKLPFGDDVFQFNDFEPTSEKSITPNMHYNLDTDIQNISSATEDVDSHLSLKRNAAGIDATYVQICEKYFGQVPKALNYGYFVDKGIIYVVTLDPHRVYIISKGVIISEERALVLITRIVKLGIELKEKKTLRKNVCAKVEPYLLKWNGKSWESIKIEKRDFNTIYLPKATMNSIKRELDNFINSSELYKACSIPYKKGILLHGPPGTGKTSLVKSLAYEYQMNIYTVNINDETVNDDSIQKLLSSVAGKENKILLFEDVDSAFAEKEKIKHEVKTETVVKRKAKSDVIEEIENNNKIEENMQNGQRSKFLTYSGLLNALDGVMTNHHGVITIMTTNYIEKLGSALTRPGRIDSKFLLRECNKEQIIDMTENIFSRYFEICFKNNSVDSDSPNKKYSDLKFRTDKIIAFANNVVGENEFSLVTPSKLQVYILRYINKNMDDIFANYAELLTKDEQFSE